MFRPLMSIIRELYLYLTKVISMLKILGKITSLYKLGDVTACRRAACVLCAVQSETAVHVCCVQCRVRLSHVGAILLCILM